MDVGTLVTRAARRFPDRVAVDGPTGSLTFAELGDRVVRLANALLALGLEPGDRVLDLQSNSVTYLETDLAIAKRTDGMGRADLAQWRALEEVMRRYDVIDRPVDVTTAWDAIWVRAHDGHERALPTLARDGFRHIATLVHDIDVLRSLVGAVKLEHSTCHVTFREGVFDTAEKAAETSWICRRDSGEPK